MRLTAEAPPGGRRGGRGGGGMGMRGGQGWPGWMRGSPRIEVKESHYLTFWSGDEVRATRSIPRVITVHLGTSEPVEADQQGPGN